MAGQLGGSYRHSDQSGHSPLATSARREREQAAAKLVTVNHLMAVVGVWFLSVGIFVALFAPAWWVTGIFGLTLPTLPTLSRWGVARIRARNEAPRRNRTSRREQSSLRLRIHDWLRSRLDDAGSGRDRL